MAIGSLLLLLQVVILVKTSRILKGIVKDRLKVLTQREIDEVILSLKSSTEKKDDLDPRSKKESPPVDHDPTSTHLEPEGVVYTALTGLSRDPRSNKIKFKTLAMAVRAIIRMQMSALCHQALHHHDGRFWFRKPAFLLRLFQFSTFGQAFYLLWFSLVQSRTILDGTFGGLKLGVTIAIPILTVFVILPLTMPSLVLALSLTGFFVEQSKPLVPVNKSNKAAKVPPNSQRDHIRRLRRSYLNYSRAESESGHRNSRWSLASDISDLDHSSTQYPPRGRRSSVSRRSTTPGSTRSGSDVFLRLYDSPSPNTVADEEECHDENLVASPWTPTGVPNHHRWSRMSTPQYTPAANNNRPPEEEFMGGFYRTSALTGPESNNQLIQDRESRTTDTGLVERTSTSGGSSNEGGNVPSEAREDELPKASDELV